MKTRYIIRFLTWDRFAKNIFLIDDGAKIYMLRSKLIVVIERKDFALKFER